MRFLLVPLVSALVLAGCAGPSSAPVSGDEDVDAVPGPISPLVGMVEPGDLLAPTFDLLGAVAKGGPLYGAGEPGIVGAMDGSIYVSFPGCDDGPYYFVSYPDSDTCEHGLIYKSSDGGATFERLNRDGDGRLTEDGPAANGDADVAVDSEGTVYASNLGGGGIQFLRSTDGGDTWEYMANVVPVTEDPDDDPERREGADRQWLAAAGPGHVINAWMRTSPKRDVEINTTFDGGLNWTGRAYFGDDIGWLGSPQFAPDGMHAYIPYTQPLGTSPVGLGVAETFEMHVIRTADGGLTWEDVPTGMTWETTATSVHWSGGYMAPTLDVTGDGTVVVGMATERLLVGGLPAPNVGHMGTMVWYTTSTDNGTTWAPQDWFGDGFVFSTSNIVFPWITGGAGDRWAITYYRSEGAASPDAAGTVWDLKVKVFDRQDDGSYESVTSVIDDDVHEGPICTRGGVCAGPVDRTLLDYFESDMMPDGRLVVVYPADPAADAGKEIELRVAIQDGGSLLAVPAS